MKYIKVLIIAIIFSFFSISVTFAAVTTDLTTKYNLRIDGSGSNHTLGWPETMYVDINNNGKSDLALYSDGDDAVYIILDDILDDYFTLSNEIDLSDSNNYSVKITDVNNRYTFGDFDNDGKTDAVIGNYLGDSSGKSNNGEVYIINNDQLVNQPKGTTFAASSSSKYSYVIRGAVDGDLLSYQTLIAKDLDNDGKDDLLITATRTDYVIANGGSAYWIPNSVINSSSTGNALELTDSSSYRVRIDGAVAGASSLGLYLATAFDANNDGKYDLALGSAQTTHLSRSTSGGVYIIPYTKIPEGIGNTIDLSDDTTYSILFVGRAANYRLGVANNQGQTNQELGTIGSLFFRSFFDQSPNYWIANDLMTPYFDNSNATVLDLNDSSSYTASFTNPGRTILVSIGDYTGDGIVDYIFDDSNSDEGATNTGTAYLLDSSVLTGLSGTGNTFDYTNADTYIQKWYGDSTSTSFMTQFYTPPEDVNGDGLNDFLFGSDWTAYNGSRSGSIWIVLNFPHTVSVSLSSLDINSDSQIVGTIAGNVNATNSVTNIAGVQWSLSNSPSGTWTNCSAVDGSFNSNNEEYSCNISSSISDSQSKIYLRSFDEGSVYTPQSNYYEQTIYTSSGLSSESTSVSVYDPITGKSYDKYFKQSSLEDLSATGENQYPQFCFTKAYDSTGGTGIVNYTLRVDGRNYISSIPYVAPSPNEYGAYAEGSNIVVKEYNDYVLKYINYNTISEKQEICAWGTGKEMNLYKGFHTWSVKAIDYSGNTVESAQSSFLTGTFTGSFNGSVFGTAGWGKFIGPGAFNENVATTMQSARTWFPLVVKQIGNLTNINGVSSLQPTIFDRNNPYIINTQTPTFYGITTIGSNISLRIDKVVIDDITGELSTETYIEKQTIGNALSQWGINVSKDKPLLNNTLYLITLFAESDSGQKALIKDLPITYNGANIYTEETAISSNAQAKVLSPTPQTIAQSIDTVYEKQPKTKLQNFIASIKKSIQDFF